MALPGRMPRWPRVPLTGRHGGEAFGGAWDGGPLSYRAPKGTCCESSVGAIIIMLPCTSGGAHGFLMLLGESDAFLAFF